MVHGIRVLENLLSVLSQVPTRVTQGVAECPPISRPLREEECLAASRQIAAAEGETQGRNYLVADFWNGMIPTGCSVISDGDWTAHFQRNPYPACQNYLKSLVP